jgi:hypothetical protein
MRLWNLTLLSGKEQIVLVEKGEYYKGYQLA